METSPAHLYAEDSAKPIVTLPKSANWSVPNALKKSMLEAWRNCRVEWTEKLVELVERLLLEIPDLRYKPSCKDVLTVPFVQWNSVDCYVEGNPSVYKVFVYAKGAVFEELDDAVLYVKNACKDVFL